MRLRAAGRTAPARRSQRNGMRVQRADGTNACRQSERHHQMREHGCSWQQSELCWLTLLSNTVTLAFRNPDMSIAMAVHRLVRSGDLQRFEHHQGQGWSDLR